MTSLPQKRVLDEIADKQKAVPKEVKIASIGTVYCWCHIGTLKSSKSVVNYVKIADFRGFRGEIWANSGGAVADKKNMRDQ